MVRKLSLAIALALGVTPFAANSLGLGDIKPKSGLNQQFQADIELLSIRDEELGDIRVSLASEEVFAKAGVNRPYFLSQLKFKPVRLPNGKGIIRVTSGEPVREPFLNFLIELNWPKGRLFREFTVLLDPPATLQRKPAPVQAATTTREIRTTGKAPSDNAVRSADVGNGGIAEYGPTRRNDTLWKIASEVRHSGTSVEQMMMAMFQANPQAFIKNNINNLKVGEILRVPERETVLAMTDREARIAFRDQLENWRSDRVAPEPAGPESATDKPVESAADAVTKDTPVAELDESAVPEAELKIARMRTAEEAGKSVADSVDQSGGSTSLTEDLLEARELRESALQESKELKSRVENLASQLEDLQRLLELKDEQLAKLQLALGEKSDIPVEPKPEVPEISAPDSAVAPAVLEQTAESPPEMSAAGEGTEAPNLEDGDEKAVIDTPQTEGIADPAAGAADKAPTAAPEMEDKTAMMPAPAESVAVAEPKPAVVTADEKMEVKPAPAAEPAPVQKPEAGFMEKLTSHPLLKKITGDPVMLAIGAGVIAVLLALIWLLTGRRRKEDQGFEEFQESILTDTVKEKEDAIDTDQAELAESDSGSTEETSFLSDFSPSEIDELPEETGEVDPMAEADVYIAYGRYGQAEELIRQGLERNPRNQDLKLKLLEILYAMKNTAAFTALAQEVKAAGVSDADPGAWESVATMGAKLDPGNSLFAADLDQTSTPALDAKDEMNELSDLDLGDLAASLDFDDEPKDEQVDERLSATAEPAQEAKLPESPDEGGLKLSLSEDDNAVDMDNLGDELASLESALDLDLDKVESDGLDLQKIAQEAVNPAESEDAALELPSLELENEAAAAEEPGFSIEDIESLDLDTEEIERLELPDVEELSEDSLGEMVADAAYSSDEINTKLDLARAYLDMGDEEGARSILQEVVNEGSEQQKQVAQKMMGGFS